MPLTKVISGGQTGVDQAALRAAKNAGLQTGGWAPVAYMTHTGHSPELHAKYGLLAVPSGEFPFPAYAYRTHLNVRDSDATLRIATKWNSPGEKCTLRAIIQHGRPHLDITPPGVYSAHKVQQMNLCVDWIMKCGVEVLNVAGNSERTCPGIGVWAESFLTYVFSALQEAANKGK